MVNYGVLLEQHRDLRHRRVRCLPLGARHQFAQAQGSGGSVGARQQSSARTARPPSRSRPSGARTARRSSVRPDHETAFHRGNLFHSTLPTSGGSGMSMMKKSCPARRLGSRRDRPPDRPRARRRFAGGSGRPARDPCGPRQQQRQEPPPAQHRSPRRSTGTTTAACSTISPGSSAAAAPRPADPTSSATSSAIVGARSSPAWGKRAGSMRRPSPG